MKKEVAALRARIEKTVRGTNGRRKFDDDVRRQAAALARRCVENGESVRSLAESLGLNPATLYYWLKTTTSSPMVRAVELVEREVEAEAPREEPGHLVVVLPSGVRIEGLQLADVIDLVRNAR